MLKSLKRHYCKSLLQKLLLRDQEGDFKITFVKKLNVKDATYLSADAWGDISSLTLSKSWLKVLGTSHDIREVSDDRAQDRTCEKLAQQIDSNLSNDDITDWIGADGDDPGYWWWLMVWMPIWCYTYRNYVIQDLASGKRFTNLRQWTFESCLSKVTYVTMHIYLYMYMHMQQSVCIHNYVVYCMYLVHFTNLKSSHIRNRGSAEHFGYERMHCIQTHVRMCTCICIWYTYQSAIWCLGSTCLLELSYNSIVILLIMASTLEWVAWWVATNHWTATEYQPTHMNIVSKSTVIIATISYLENTAAISNCKHCKK